MFNSDTCFVRKLGVCARIIGGESDGGKDSKDHSVVPVQQAGNEAAPDHES